MQTPMRREIDEFSIVSIIPARSLWNPTDRTPNGHHECTTGTFEFKFLPSDRSNFSGAERGVRLVSISCAKHDTALCVCLRIWATGVLFEIFLRDSVEGKRRNRAFKKGCRHSPCTAGAAPAAEVIAVDTNEALFHGHLRQSRSNPRRTPAG